MYGGMKENFIEEIVQRTCLKRADIFADLGSGIGQVIMITASTALLSTLLPTSDILIHK